MENRKLFHLIFNSIALSLSEKINLVKKFFLLTQDKQTKLIDILQKEQEKVEEIKSSHTV